MVDKYMHAAEWNCTAIWHNQSILQAGAEF